MGDVWWFIFATGVFFWLIPIACGVVAAVVSVGVIGPRDDLDALILPGMAASGASFVSWFELDGWGWMAAIGVSVAAVTAVGQRWALDRIDRASPSWPRLSAALTITAGVLIGGFLGYLAARAVDVELIAVGACLGGAVGAAATMDWGRGRDQPE